MYGGSCRQFWRFLSPRIWKSAGIISLNTGTLMAGEGGVEKDSGGEEVGLFISKMMAKC